MVRRRNNLYKSYVVCISQTYFLIVACILKLFGDGPWIPSGVEPVLWGVCSGGVAVSACATQARGARFR